MPVVVVVVSGALIAAVLIVGTALAGVHRCLARRRRAVDRAWRQIEVQLRRRHDLVPLVVANVGRTRAPDRRTLDLLTSARVAAINAEDMARQSSAEGALAAALRSAVRTHSTADVHGEVSDAEHRIAHAADRYNAAVRDYNAAVGSAPVVAHRLGFARREQFTPSSSSSVGDVGAVTELAQRRA